MHDATARIALPTISDTVYLHAAAFLARYSGDTRQVYATRLKLFLTWCADQGLDPIHGVTRPHLELYARHLEEVRGNKPASVHGALCVLKMFYRYARPRCFGSGGGSAFREGCPCAAPSDGCGAGQGGGAGMYESAGRSALHFPGALSRT